MVCTNALSVKSYRKNKLTKLQLLGLLIEHGANLEIKNREGQTPLFAAVKYRNIHAAKFLIGIE